MRMGGVQGISRVYDTRSVRGYLGMHDIPCIHRIQDSPAVMCIHPANKSGNSGRDSSRHIQARSGTIPAILKAKIPNPSAGRIFVVKRQQQGCLCQTKLRFSAKSASAGAGSQRMNSQVVHPGKETVKWEKQPRNLIRFRPQRTGMARHRTRLQRVFGEKSERFFSEKPCRMPL